MKFNYMTTEFCDFLADSFGMHTSEPSERSGVLFAYNDKVMLVDSWGLEQFIDDLICLGFENMSGHYNLMDSLCSVQPLSDPSGEIFKLKVKY